MGVRVNIISQQFIDVEKCKYFFFLTLDGNSTKFTLKADKLDASVIPIFNLSSKQDSKNCP